MSTINDFDLPSIGQIDNKESKPQFNCVFNPLGYSEKANNNELKFIIKFLPNLLDKSKSVIRTNKVYFNILSTDKRFVFSSIPDSEIDKEFTYSVIIPIRKFFKEFKNTVDLSRSMNSTRENLSIIDMVLNPYDKETQNNFYYFKYKSKIDSLIKDEMNTEIKEDDIILEEKKNPFSLDSRLLYLIIDNLKDKRYLSYDKTKFLSNQDLGNKFKQMLTDNRLFQNYTNKLKDFILQNEEFVKYVTECNNVNFWENIEEYIDFIQSETGKVVKINLNKLKKIEPYYKEDKEDIPNKSVVKNNETTEKNEFDYFSDDGNNSNDDFDF